MRDLTEAQRQVLVIMLRLCLPGFFPGDLVSESRWVSWSRVADELGRTGRGRAAVVATLNRLVEGPEPLVAWGTEPEGDVVALTSAGVCVAWDLCPEDIPRFEIEWGEDGSVEKLSLYGGLVRLEVVSRDYVMFVTRDLLVEFGAAHPMPFIHPSIRVQATVRRAKPGVGDA